MTIQENICLHLIEDLEERLEKLRAMHAPQVIIDKDEETLTNAKAGTIPVKGDIDLLNLHFTSVECLKGRGGKYYREYETDRGTVCYFPQARYGRFITMKGVPTI